MASSAEAADGAETSSPLRIGIVAGEASGDILGAGLIAALRKRFPDAVFEGIAGPLMQAAGCRSLYPMEKLSVMGLVEVLRHLPELLAIRRGVIRHFINQPPDVFIGIDAPDFNFAVEQALRRAAIPTVHYVSPSVWAWREYRVRKIARSTDLMLTLFPFETDFYARHGMNAVFVGHPLAEMIADQVDAAAARQRLGLPQGPVVALLPGSRRSEVEQLIAPFLATAQWCLRQRPELHFVVPVANPRVRLIIETHMAALPPQFPLTLIEGRSREAMAAADVVLLASGTATLEALMLKRPMVVAYRLARLTYWLAKRMLRTSYYSLPNYLAGRKVVPEVTQDDVTAENLGPLVLGYLAADKRNETEELFGAIHRQLRCDASERAADAVLQLIGRSA